MLQSPTSRRFDLFAAASTSVASNRRRRPTLPSSAIIGCWAKHETRAQTPSGDPSLAISGGGMTPYIAGTADTRAALDRLLAELRPKLHRYCARMTGSVIAGEDVVQEALMKAIEAFPQAQSIAHPEGWLFRIAHNAALDFLRRRARQESVRVDEDPEMIVDPATPVRDRQIAAASLRTFMRLPAAQCSSVILMDVLGYSL